MEKQGTKKNNEHETEIKKNNNSLFFFKRISIFKYIL